MISVFDIQPNHVFAQELPHFTFLSKTYIVYKTPEPLKIDGVLDEPAWQQITWTSLFLDIRGGHLPTPRFETKAKMAWNDHYFYIAAQLEEPHVWATIKERDAVIFMENNFEVFLDPDGDTHHYYELEVNALGTFWDLLLTRPYRNGGKPLNEWDIKGLKIGIDVQGTVNNPSDTDKGWTVEIAIPFDALDETARYGMPSDSSQWRLNFSRVEWQLEVENERYIKKKDSQTGKNLPEDNWVWSPQGIINMHLPERWGIIQFSEKTTGADSVSFVQSTDFQYSWILRELYDRQRTFFKQRGYYAEHPDQLNADEIFEEYDVIPEVEIQVHNNSYIMSLTTDQTDSIFYIREDSKTWKTTKN